MNTVNTPNAGVDLIRIHKVITRGLVVSIKHSQGNGPEQAHRDGFRSYVRALVALLHGHHLGEDEIAFPFWKGRVSHEDLDKLYQQHQAMLPLLEKVEAWMENVAAWESTLLAELNDVFRELDALWHGHITLEESVLGPDNSAELLSPEENLQLSQRLAAHGQQHSQPSELVLPFVLYNLDGADRQAMMANLPAELTAHVIPVVWKAAWEPMQQFFLE